MAGNTPGPDSEYTLEIEAKARWYVYEGGWKELKHAVPSVFGLAVYLGYCRDTLYVWKDKFPAFAKILSFNKTYQVHEASNGALIGNFNPKIAAMMMAQFEDYVEKISTDHTSSDGSMTPQVIERRIVDPSDKDA